MYSKERGMPPSQHLRPHGAPAYRQPPRERLRVPANYSGHAIVDGEEQPLGTLPIREPLPPSPELPAPGDPPTLRFDDLPRVSELGDGHRRQGRVVTPSLGEADPPRPPLADIPDSVGTPAPAPEAAVVPGAMSLSQPPSQPPFQPPALRPSQPPPRPPYRPASLFSSTSFPFGHGLGGEELLLLGLILLLLHENAGNEDRGDLDQTVLLLGLLLFLG